MKDIFVPKPQMHSLSYILGFPTQDVMQRKVQQIAAEKEITTDYAWLGIVYKIIEELQDEDSEASLSAILTLMMERPVIAPKLYLLPYDIQKDRVTRKHPMICFQMRNVIDADMRGFIEIDKQMADQIAEVLQVTFECDFVETVFVQ